MKAIGKKTWAFAAGHIPLVSTGIEPHFSSHDKISILNTSEEEAEVHIAVLYDDGDPIGDYSVAVKSRRVRKIRFNDLIDPLPVPLDKPYGFILKSSVRVVVQFNRMDTSSPFVSGLCVTAFAKKENV
jgi:hypothetical protein